MRGWHGVSSYLCCVVVRSPLPCSSRHLLSDPHSLPCQHHFCGVCIPLPLERTGGCPTCRNKFWAKDLRVNTSINSMIDNYRAMRAWVRAKARRLGQTFDDAAGEEDEQRRRRDDQNRKRDDDEEGEGGKENSPSRRTTRGGAAQNAPSPHAAKGGAASSTPARRPAASTKHHTTTSPPTRTSPSSAFLSPSAGSGGGAVSSSAHTPQRVSLKDALAAVNETPTRHPTSSLSSLPRPTETTSPAPPHAVATTTLHAPTSHSKTFSKQAVIKKTHSPVPPAATTSATAPLATTAHTSAFRALHTPKQLDPAVRAALFGDDDDEEEERVAELPDDDEVMEVSADTFARNKDDRRKTGTSNTTVASLAPMTTTTTTATVFTAPLKRTPSNSNSASVRPWTSAAAAKSSTLERFFAPPTTSTSTTTTTQLAKAVPLPSPPSPQNPAQRAETANGAPAATNVVDRDGDATMAPVDPAHARLAPNAPIGINPPSLWPKMFPSPPGARESSDSSEPPPPALEGSLSLPRSSCASPLPLLHKQDSLGSPPPLEMAPPINLYSPAPAIWGETQKDEESEEAVADHRARDTTRTTMTRSNADAAAAAVIVVDSASQMEIDTPPPRRSLAKDLASLQAAPTIDMPAAAAAATTIAPVAATTTAEPISAVATDIAAATVPALAPAPLPAAPVEVGDPVVDPAETQSISRAASHATAVSVQLSLPMLTEVSVAMPSMGAPSAPPSQHTPTTRAPSPADAPLVDHARPDDEATQSAPPPLPDAVSVPAPTEQPPPPPPATAVVPPSPPEAPQAATSLSMPVDSSSDATTPPPAARSSPMTIAFSSLSAEERAALSGFAARMGGCTLVSGRTWTTDVSHVVLKTKSDVSPRLASRSLKYMHGVLCGAWVVSWSWVTASIAAGRWVDEAPFEIEGDASKGVSHTPAIMRRRLANTNGMTTTGERLLKGIKFCVHHDLAAGRDPSVLEVQTLITSGHGVVIPAPPALMTPTADANSGATAPAQPPPSTTSLLAHGGISRLPSVAATPGPIYLLLRGDAHKVYAPSDMASLASRVGMIPVTVPWLLDSISAGHMVYVDLFRCDFTQEHKRTLREQKEREMNRHRQPQQTTPPPPPTTTTTTTTA